jgi:hypothetical protein
MVRNDRAFIVPLVKEVNGVLQCASKELRCDHDILTAAVAKDGANLVDCFGTDRSLDDLECLFGFAKAVRARLQSRDSFVREFLRGISICDQSHVAPANWCRLPLLD